MDKKWLTIKEVAERFNISRSTVYRWNKIGMITFHQFGRQLPRIDIEEVKLLEEKIKGE